MPEFDQDLDVRGLSCPLPLLKTKKQLVLMAPGQVLRVRATDPHSVIDFMVFCAKTGQTLLSHWQEADEYHFLFKRKAD